MLLARLEEGSRIVILRRPITQSENIILKPIANVFQSTSFLNTITLSFTASAVLERKFAADGLQCRFDFLLAPDALVEFGPDRLGRLFDPLLFIVGGV